MARGILFLFIVLSATSVQARVRGRVNHPKPAAPPPPSFDINAVNNPATQDVIGLKANGSAVLRAQILLDRAHYSVGEINGIFGPNTENTVKDYQFAHGMQPDGVIQQNMWQALNADKAPALTPYTITMQDTVGPFVRIPADMMKKAKLPFLGYESPQEELGERFHGSPKLLETLNPGKDFKKPGEQIVVPNVQRAPITEPVALVIVRKSCGCLDVIGEQNNLLAHYPATMGSEHDPLPIGDWKLEKPIRNPFFHYNPKLFWDAKAKDAKATIKPGPKNPVGVVWIGLSKEHYGIHGTPEPSAIGKTQSHGCIRLTNWDASELADLVKPGMTANLRE